MGQPAAHPPALLFLAIFTRHDEAMQWGLQMAIERWQQPLVMSADLPFSETDYYEQEMGPGLFKRLLVFAPCDPAALPDIKLLTNHWEAEYASRSQHPEPRPLNLDPGYVTEAKLVLATTKDNAHRIYLRDGIFAEVTLSYRSRRWQPHPWTYADYQRDDYHAFLLQARQQLRALRRP